MDARAVGGWAAVLLLGAAAARADEPVWRPAPVAAPSAAPVSIARPRPLVDGPAPPTIRAQAPDAVPPPPPFPGPAGGLPAPADGPFNGPTPYNCGQVNSNADLGFWGRCGQKLSRAWSDTSETVGGIFTTSAGHKPFQSDHCLDMFASPVTNPFYFEDPRALTEIKTLFMWQHTPTANPYFDGGNNYFGGIQARVAFTQWLSFVVSELGVRSLNPRNGGPVGLAPATGFSEVQLGPKVTFIRDANTGTAAAFGLMFEVPVGSARVLADTGTLSLRPYFSFAQNFGTFKYGSFNFMNTTGYDLGVDQQRNDFFFTSAHLDYDVNNKHVFYPLVELNYILYPQNGGARDLGFGGGDLFNFGSYGTAGHSELTAALGFRWKIVGEAVQFGLAGQSNVLSNGSGRHLDLFRLTADLIFRY